MGFDEIADLLGALPRLEAQCCMRRSFPITAAGQPRNARRSDSAVTGFPFQPAPAIGAGTENGHKILGFAKVVNHRFAPRFRKRYLRATLVRVCSVAPTSSSGALNSSAARTAQA
jgi:hypothetical protein